MRGGVIVAGGYSTRFTDGDKALAEIDGTPMIRHVADRIAPVIDTLVINGRIDQLDAFAEAMDGYQHPVDYAADEVPGQGPVAGIANGLAAMSGDIDGCFVVACDMPYVDSTLVEGLFDRFDSTETDAVVPRTEDGWHQVLHAVYDPVSMVDACRRALIDDERKVLAPLSHLSVTEVPVEDERSFENVNTVDDLERARSWLRETDTEKND